MRKLLYCGVAAVALAVAAPAFAQDAKPGGEIIVTYKDDVATLDPAIGYDWQNWSMIKSLFDGLMDYEPGTSTLRNDLAESYEISPDGMIFTFKLRPGVKFHNGRELTAEDVKYSIDRVVDPATQSPGAGFFGSIKTITVVDPLTIKFELSRPDATFLHVMAINFAHVVPKEEVEKHGRRFRQEPGRHRRLQARRMDARPAPRLREERRLLARRRALSRQDHHRGRPGAERGAAPPAAGRGRHPRRPHSARAVPAGEGRCAIQGLDRGGRPAPHRLRHHERQDAAFRQRQGSAGREHGHQQGPHHAHHQQSRRTGEPAVAAHDARLRHEPMPAMPTTRPRPRRCSPRPATRTALRPSSTPTTPTPIRASPRRSSRIWRRSASRRRSSRSPRRTSSRRAATAARR